MKNEEKKQVVVLKNHVMTDEEWNRLAYKNRLERSRGILKKQKNIELMELLGYQSVFKYCEGEELIKSLQEIANLYLPSWIVNTEEVYKSLVYAFTYGAVCGVRHERKRRKEKANRAKGGAF